MRPGTICAGFPSCLGFGVGGQSYSNFLASIVCPEGACTQCLKTITAIRILELGASKIVYLDPLGFSTLQTSSLVAAQRKALQKEQIQSRVIRMICHHHFEVDLRCMFTCTCVYIYMYLHTYIYTIYMYVCSM